MKSAIRLGIAYAVAAGMATSLLAQEFTRVTAGTNLGGLERSVAVATNPLGGDADYFVAAGYRTTPGQAAATVVSSSMCYDYIVEVNTLSPLIMGTFNDIIFDQYDPSILHVSVGSHSRTPYVAGSEDILLSLGAFNQLNYVVTLGTATRNERANAIVQTAPGTFVIVGEVENPSTPTNKSAFAMAVKINSSPVWSTTILWQKVIGTTSTSFSDVIYDQNGCVYALGSTLHASTAGNYYRTYLAEMNASTGALGRDMTTTISAYGPFSQYFGMKMTYDAGCGPQGTLFFTGQGSPNTSFNVDAFVEAVDIQSWTTYDMNFLPNLEDVIDLKWNPVRGQVAACGLARFPGQDEATIMELDYCGNPNSPTVTYSTALDMPLTNEFLFSIDWHNYWNSYITVGFTEDINGTDYFTVSHPPGTATCPQVSYNPVFTQIATTEFTSIYTASNASFTVLNSYGHTWPQYNSSNLCSNPLCRTEGTTGGDDILMTSQMTVSPSPAADLIQVNCAGDWKASITVFDTQGRQVKSISTTDLQVTLDISELPAGIYLLRRETLLGEQVTQKFVKE